MPSKTKIRRLFTNDHFIQLTVAVAVAVVLAVVVVVVPALLVAEALDELAQEAFRVFPFHFP